MPSCQAASLLALSLPGSSVLKLGGKAGAWGDIGWGQALGLAQLRKGRILRVWVTAPSGTGLAGCWGSMKGRGGDGRISWTGRYDTCMSKSWC